MTDKLTIAPPVTVRFTVDGLAALKGLAAFNGMNESEYIRHLVTLDMELHKQKWEALTPLFVAPHTPATNTRSDKVGRA